MNSARQRIESPGRQRPWLGDLHDRRYARRWNSRSIRTGSMKRGQSAQPIWPRSLT